jgi:hypothetical protein
MGLVISKGLTLRKGWQPMDPDAAAYITAVETADGQALEEKTKIAIDNFVLGCKADGIWDAIKASCILAGARTRLGALTPLVGTAPTSINFVDGDYNRKTGLVGNGSTKYLDSNRNSNADPQDSAHLSVYASTVRTVGTTLIGGSTNAFTHRIDQTATQTSHRINASASSLINGNTGFIGATRRSSASFDARANGTTTSLSNTSVATSNNAITVFAYNVGGAIAASTYINARLAFYSIGESLDLALLDARVTDLINAFGAAIP